MTAIVAIVGRPNVGKSTLFNRLVGRPVAIVHDAPGVTRDRHYADGHLHGRELTLVDTGGFDRESEDPVGQSVARQVEVAIAEADLVLCVLDGSATATPADRDAVQLLRRSGKPVVYAANKVDGPAREGDALGLYELGIERIHPISALHGRGLAELEAAVAAGLPAPTPHATLPDETATRVALAGRPNAGKSSLFNRLVGAERSLVDARPGTTRDPVDTRVEYAGRAYVLVDTAGIRRRARVDRGVEAAAVIRALRAAERAEVVVLMCDATEGVSEQDARLLGLCAERRRAIVVALNKVDALAPSARRAAYQAAREPLVFAPWAPIVPVSAKTGFGIPELMCRVSDAATEFKRRVPTGELNRFFEQVIERQPPPTSAGRAPRLFYITQAETAPPLFVAVSSAPEAIPASYRRFVANQIRKTFGFESVPILVRYRSRRRRER
jgi:GTP-binding protein